MIKQRLEIESIEELDQHVRAGGAFGGYVFQGLELLSHTAALMSGPLVNTLFLGCRVAPEAIAHAHATGSVFFPELPDLPYSMYRPFLYSVAELYDGYQRGIPGSYERAFDCRVYRHYSQSRKVK